MNWLSFSVETYSKLNQLFNEVHRLLYPLSSSILSFVLKTVPQLQLITDSIGTTITTTIIEFIILMSIVNIISGFFQRISRLIGFFFNTALFWGFFLFLAYLYFKLETNNPSFNSEKKRAFENLSKKVPFDPKLLENMPEEVYNYFINAMGQFANQAHAN